MKCNTLVIHKKLPLGIGCVVKVFKSSVNVNFGESDVVKVKTSLLDVVDVSMCDTVDWSEIRKKVLLHQDDIPLLIIGNEVKEWVGFGFVTKNVVTNEDLSKYKRII
jgi:hypothetical protein